jgi:regulator of sigma E protease
MDIMGIFSLVAQNAWLYGGAFILVLSVLVFVHEFGHYYVARKCGVRVEVFSIGFGPELFGFYDKHRTRWKFSLIPLGGYVKMFGDSDPASAGHEENVATEAGGVVRPMTEDERKVAFFSQPVSKRAAIVIAGPLINFLFAIIILAGLYMTLGQQVTPPVAAAIVQGSAAEKAGFLPNDEIIAIDGKQIRRFEEIRREVMIGLDTERVYTIKRDGEVIDVTATPEKLSDEDRFGFAQSRGYLGLIAIGNAVKLDHISEINGNAVSSADAARSLIMNNFGKVITITVRKGNDTTDTLQVLPVAAMNEGLIDSENAEFNQLNLAHMKGNIIIVHKPLAAFFEAVHETFVITKGTLNAMGQMVTGTRSAKELGGLIRIGAMAGDMAQAGFIALITFAALLSINLGLINLFPIPMLDGGHLTFYAIEAIKGSPIPEHVQEYAFRMGMILLIGIMLFANINDIVQIAS